MAISRLYRLCYSNKAEIYKHKMTSFSYLNTTKITIFKAFFSTSSPPLRHTF